MGPHNRANPWLCYAVVVYHPSPHHLGDGGLGPWHCADPGRNSQFLRGRFPKTAPLWGNTSCSSVFAVQNDKANMHQVKVGLNQFGLCDICNHSPCWRVSTLEGTGRKMIRQPCVLTVNLKKKTPKLISLVASVFLMGKLILGNRKMKLADHVVPRIKCYHSRVLYTEDSKYCRYVRDDSVLLK